MKSRKLWSTFWLGGGGRGSPGEVGGKGSRNEGGNEQKRGCENGRKTGREVEVATASFFLLNEKPAI